MIKDKGKPSGEHSGMPLELASLGAGEVNGIPSVAVKCVDIRKNTSGEGGLLDRN